MSPPPWAAPPDAPPADELPSILVVDDRPANLMSVLEILRAEGRAIVTASSGIEALRILMDRDFSVILLDVNMPGMDGFEVARMIRQRPRSALTPIIFVTAISMDDAAIRRGYELGAVDYIFSPIVPVVLRAKVAVFMDLHINTCRLQASLREREASEARYRALFHDSPVALWELDLEEVRRHLDLLAESGDGELREVFQQQPAELAKVASLVKLLDVNRAALEMLDADDAGSVEAALPQVFGENSPHLLEDQLVALRNGHTSTEAEAVLRTLRHGLKHVNLRVSLLPGHEQTWSRIVVSSTDIAELHRQRAELERSNRELQQFAYVASHDLRAPLRAIDALSQWLEQDLQGAFSEAQRGQMNLLRGRVRRMDRLLSDLLEYARAGGEEVDVERVDVAALVAEVVELCSPPPGFAVDAAAPLPTLATARMPLRRILLNLIGNAIKHHDRPGGKVTVAVRAGQEFLTFVVSDDGPGIPPRFHEKVFQMFQTLKPRDTVEGSGMGLALVRKLVENAGGAIWIETPRERGTAFLFTWPREWQRQGRLTPGGGVRVVAAQGSGPIRPRSVP